MAVVGGIAGVIGTIVLMMSVYEGWRQHQPTVSVVEALQRPQLTAVAMLGSSEFAAT